jgi:hypothetical protein
MKLRGIIGLVGLSILGAIAVRSLLVQDRKGRGDAQMPVSPVPSTTNDSEILASIAAAPELVDAERTPLASVAITDASSTASEVDDSFRKSRLSAINRLHERLIRDLKEDPGPGLFESAHTLYQLAILADLDTVRIKMVVAS